MAVAATGFPPCLFLIGAQKAGTTSLAYLLNQHPDIAVSEPKEPGFFAANFDRGWDWYRRCFPDALPKVLVDASTGYSMAPLGSERADLVPRRIREHVPEARFIYVLRDPVDRTISAFWHDRRAGRLDGSLRTAVASDPFYLDVSRYHSQIGLYLAHFPRERFLFIDFNDLATDAVAVARRCIAHAGLDPDRARLDLGAPKNTAFEFNRIGRMLFDRFPSEQWAGRFVATAKRVTPGILHRAAKSALTRDPEAVAPADRAWLAGLFGADNRAMESLAGFRFYR